MPNLWFELMDTCLSCHENGPTPEDHKHFGQAFPEAISWISVLGWSATPEGFIYKVSLQSPCQQSILGLVPGHFTHLAPHLYPGLAPLNFLPSYRRRYRRRRSGAEANSIQSWPAARLSRESCWPPPEVSPVSPVSPDRGSRWIQKKGVKKELNHGELKLTPPQKNNHREKTCTGNEA